jgi:hypothetical protein
MPLDVLGRTRATLMHTASTFQLREAAGNQQYASCLGLIFGIIDHERGIPSKRNSLDCVD